MRFTYRSGQQPLEGYTIKRGVGQGGFGEVYFAVSDGGKEVALKLLHGHSDVELRGVANCLNMKHPNLVHVYDLKEDNHGDKWLVMEFVLGESLAQVLNRYDHGLPYNLVLEWFNALAKAVAHLHDRGVVHRDLKPANIFIEAGTLKVGDYGLCKSLSTSQRQTKAVGTVHYMAPEISTGNYSQSIDIYACGVILHELLTGDVPFDGESEGEILMKHLTAIPNLDHVPVELREIIAKALEKNPNKRFSTILEMAKAVEVAILPLLHPSGVPSAKVAAVPVKKSNFASTKPAPSGDDAVPIPANVELQPEIAPILPVANRVQVAAPIQAGLPVAKSVSGETWRDRITGLTGALIAAPVVAALGLVPYGLLSRATDWAPLAELFLVSTGLAWAVLLGTGVATYRAEDSWIRRFRMLLMGLVVGGLAYWLDGGKMPNPAAQDRPFWSILGLIDLPTDQASILIRYMLYFGGAMGASKWWKATARDRKERFSLGPVIAAGFWAVLLLFLWPLETASVANAIMPLILTAIAVQAVSPWRAPLAERPRRLRLNEY